MDLVNIVLVGFEESQSCSLRFGLGDSLISSGKNDTQHRIAVLPNEVFIFPNGLRVSAPYVNIYGTNREEAFELGKMIQEVVIIVLKIEIPVFFTKIDVLVP
ncbi:MAG TPA: hypothetical protein P5274_01010 [Candidatus Paceibacterota bacterium]|nr:hypothetical protein [Candidatus Paceibacterota bacterium]